MGISFGRRHKRKKKKKGRGSTKKFWGGVSTCQADQTQLKNYGYRHGEGPRPYQITGGVEVITKSTDAEGCLARRDYHREKT